MKNLNLIFAIAISATLLSGTTTVSFGATNPIPSPREQMDSGISPANVVCKAGLKLIIRATTDSAACVKDSSQDRMIKIGWAKTLSALLEKKPELSKIGDVNTIKVVPVFADKNRLDTNPTIVKNYNYVFEACAKSTLIRAPEVLVTSDSETKSIKLSENISPKTCQVSSTIIKATDTNSIKANIVKKNDISLIINQLESQVKTLQDVLDKEKKQLVEIAKQTPQPTDYAKKVSEQTDKIISLRNDLNAARADLQKNQYTLIVGAKAPPVIEPPKIEEPLSMNTTDTFTSHVKILKIAAQFADAGRLKSDPLATSFNFVFDACAGENDILYPELLVRSDTESKSVKLSEPILAMSCQTSSTVIKAAEKNSIQAMIVTSGDVSKTIQELQVLVDSLKESIASDKKSLIDYVKQTPQPDDYMQKVSELTDKIIQQRNDLNKAKHDLITLKYMLNE